MDLVLFYLDFICFREKNSVRKEKSKVISLIKCTLPEAFLNGYKLLQLLPLISLSGTLLGRLSSLNDIVKQFCNYFPPSYITDVKSCYLRTKLYKQRFFHC